MDLKVCRLLVIVFVLFVSIAGFETIFVKDHLNLHKPRGFQNSLTILTTNLPPFSYVNREGEIRGSLVELVKILATRTNTSYSLEMLPMSAAYGRTISTPNTALFPLGKNVERSPLFKWVGPVDVINYAYFCRMSDMMTITSDDDIRQSRIVAVPRSTARHSILVERNFTNLLLMPNDAECVRAVLNHKADIWFGPLNLYKLDREYLGDDLNSLRIAGLGGHNPLYIGFNFDTPDAVVKLWQSQFLSLDPEVQNQVMEHQFPYFCSWIGCKNCGEEISPDLQAF